ncbi:hypothetical protein [uncultured Gimesia sp.]|uniref:hypothetical protein n=1 Tax=uncultured Gimesia sp. TaxID=1678688 RepID=UPI0030D9B19E|tara:strand:+ start:31607 stop:35479 length:3873 start_codon:yes stop_codon:yes gene_type:complete
MTNPTLLVPVHVDAYVVSQQVLDNQPMRRWAQVYTNIPGFSSSEPDFTDVSKGILTDPGVYLFWTLPAALRHGNQNPRTRQIEFPLVPNRWLIMRVSGPLTNRTAVSWVLESDAPGDESSSTYAFDPSIIKAWQSSKDPNRLAAGKRMNSQTDALVTDVLGQVFPLRGAGSQESWTEQGIPDLFVKAVAPGNPLFSAYQPHCRNVFSFHDQLTVPKDTVSYLVVGWYSNAEKDPLNICQQNKATHMTASDAYQKQLCEYKWTLAETTENLDVLDANQAMIADTDVPTSSLYHGMVFGVDWDTQKKTETIIDKDVGIHVAVGNNSIDAFKALVDRQLRDRAVSDPKVASLLKNYPNIARMLEAFQYDMLNVLDEPNGDVQLDYKIRQQWFGSKPSGYRWAIVDTSSDETQKKSDVQRKQEAEQEVWLSELNKNQATYDTAVKELQAAQWQLYATWFKKGKFDQLLSFLQPKGLTDEQFDKALTPKNDSSYDPTSPPSRNNIYSLPLAIHNQQTQISEILQPKIPAPIYQGPQNTPEQALANGIEAYSKAKRDQKQLAADRVMKAVTSPRYWSPNDPVVMITGANNTNQIKPKDSLTCRLASQIVNEIKTADGKTSITAADLGTSIPSLEVTPQELAKAMQGDFIPSETAQQFATTIGQLLNEFYFLDPVNAASLTLREPGFTEAFITQYNAENFCGVLPAMIPGDWAQPWNPLFLKWTADWYAIDFPEWKFDGTDYQYSGNVTSEPRALGGDLLLTAQTNYLFHDRLEKFVSKNPRSGELLEHLDKLIHTIDNWDMVSQALVGFSDQIGIRDSRTNRAPDQHTKYEFDTKKSKSLLELVGDQYDTLPYIKTTDDADQRDFSGVRQGQMSFTYLAIYDSFGQVLEAVGDSGLKSADVFEPILAEGFVPGKPIESRNPKRFVQLPPRLIQHSRLNFRMQDVIDDKRFVDIYQDANPVAGWLLPNHLDASIGLYDNQGISLGELRLLATDAGGMTIGWQAAPHSQFTKIDDVKSHAPHLGKIIDAIQAKSTVAFENFLQVIDETLWTVDPMGARDDQNLSVLVGRPLALVRSQLQFELDGPPLSDAGWSATFYPPVPDFIQYDFEIRLGEQELRNDGLIGYYLNDDYDIIHCVHQLEQGTPLAGYVKSIEPGNFIPLKFDGKSRAELLLLCDPRASIHAVTGILPVKTLDLPDRFVDPVLKKMEISFSVGPLLTQIQKNLGSADQGGAYPQAITVPIPAERHGQWSWWEKAYQSGQESWSPPYALANIDDSARLNDTTRSLREGSLQLQIKLEE